MRRACGSIAIPLIASVLALLALSCGEEKREVRREAAPASGSKPAPAGEGWLTFMGDLRRTGRSPDRSIRPPLRPLWRFTTGGPVTASPLVWSGMVYIGSFDGRFYALKAKEWGERWSFDSGAPIRYCGVIHNGRVFFSNVENEVFALDARTGELIWRRKLDNWIKSPPVAYGDKVYFGVFNRKIYALDAGTGRIRDRISFRTTIGGVIYICSEGELRPLNPENQAERIRKRIPFSLSSPTIANGYVFIGSRKGALHVLSEADLSEVFRYEVGGGVDSSPAVVDGVVYFGSLDGRVYALTGGVEKAGRSEGEEGMSVGRSAVRKQPDPSSQPIAYLNDGERVEIVGRKGGWLKIRLPDGQLGWSDSVVSVEEDDRFILNADLVEGYDEIDLRLGGEYPSLSPDGRFVAYPVRTEVKGQYWHADEIWVTSLQTGEHRKLCSASIYNPFLSWSLDSKWIIFETYDSNVSHIWAVDREGRELRRVAKGEAPSFSPVAHRIAFRRRREWVDSLWVVNLDGGGLRKIDDILIQGTPQQYLYLLPPAWSPDGGMIALGTDAEYYKSGYAKVRLYGLKPGIENKLVNTKSKEVLELKWSPDGRYLACVLGGNPNYRPYMTVDREIHLLDTEALRVRAFKGRSPAWSPDGSKLALMEHDEREGIEWKVWIASPKGGERELVLVSKIDLADIDWLPDGRLCLWFTSKYFREGRLGPAQTTGYLFRLKG